MPERLRGWTANPLGIALAGSNPAVFVMIINNNFFFIRLDMEVKIALFIIFTVVLSIYIMILNTSLHWWNNNCRDLTLDKDQKKNHGPNDTFVIIASVFVGIVGLTIIYSIYEFWTKGRIVGLNSFGN
jgi:hypothetical protein